MKRPTKPQQKGRPPAGPDGIRRSEMPRQIAARVTDDAHRQLRALAAVLETSQADILTRALGALEQTLSKEQQRVVRLLARRRAE